MPHPAQSPQSPQSTPSQQAPPSQRTIIKPPLPTPLPKETITALTSSFLSHPSRPIQPLQASFDDALSSNIQTSASNPHSNSNSNSQPRSNSRNTAQSFNDKLSLYIRDAVSNSLMEHSSLSAPSGFRGSSAEKSDEEIEVDILERIKDGIRVRGGFLEISAEETEDARGVVRDVLGGIVDIRVDRAEDWEDEDEDIGDEGIKGGGEKGEGLFRF